MGDGGPSVKPTSVIVPNLTLSEGVNDIFGGPSTRVAGQAELDRYLASAVHGGSQLAFSEEAPDDIFGGPSTQVGR